MNLRYQSNGNLIPGIHPISWDDFVQEYGYTLRRKALIEGLELAMTHLLDCGCDTIYIDGSFVSKERNPGDFDACLHNSSDNIDWEKLRIQYPLLLIGTRNVKIYKYKGEIYPAYSFANWEEYYLNYFQQDRDGEPKGIIQLATLKK